MFELDWRGDRNLKNKKEFLFTNPVYVTNKEQTTFESYGTIGNSELTSKIEHACIPFIPSLTETLIQKARKGWNI